MKPYPSFVAARAVSFILAIIASLTSALAAGAAEDGSWIYHCESGNVVAVEYGGTTPDTPAARLQYLGRVFKLHQVGSGQSFATEAGLSADKGLRWTSDGDKATLSEMLMDHMAPAPTVIETCIRAAPDQAMDSSLTAALPLGQWRLVSLHGTPVVTEAVITFHPDGSVNGNGGCNTFGGRAVLSASGLGVKEVFSTMMACGDAANAQEHMFLQALEQTASHRLESGELVLLDAVGDELARLGP